MGIVKTYTTFIIIEYNCEKGISDVITLNTLREVKEYLLKKYIPLKDQAENSCEGLYKYYQHIISRINSLTEAKNFNPEQFENTCIYKRSMNIEF